MATGTDDMNISIVLVLPMDKTTRPPSVPRMVLNNASVGNCAQHVIKQNRFFRHFLLSMLSQTDVLYRGLRSNCVHLTRKCLFMGWLMELVPRKS
jgi:hypothetical protein